jgi:hypothetical protein
MTTAEEISLGSMLVALAAVIIGPFISGWVAHRQIISTMRQQWIENLRISVAEFLAEIDHIMIFHDPTEPHAEPDEAAIKKMNYLENRIELILNPKKKRSQRLIHAVHAMADLTTKHAGSEAKRGDIYAELSLEIIALTQETIQAEWKKTRDVFNLPDIDDEA